MERARYNTELLYIELNINLSNFWGSLQFFRNCLFSYLVYPVISTLCLTDVTRHVFFQML